MGMPKCRQCKFWKADYHDPYEDETSEFGGCHRYPNTIEKKGDDFCGEFWSALRQRKAEREKVNGK